MLRVIFIELDDDRPGAFKIAIALNYFSYLRARKTFCIFQCLPLVRSRKLQRFMFVNFICHSNNNHTFLIYL